MHPIKGVNHAVDLVGKMPSPPPATIAPMWALVGVKELETWQRK
jgi:hypothetical protein